MVESASSKDLRLEQLLTQRPALAVLFAVLDPAVFVAEDSHHIQRCCLVWLLQVETS